MLLLLLVLVLWMLRLKAEIDGLRLLVWMWMWMREVVAVGRELSHGRGCYLLRRRLRHGRWWLGPLSCVFAAAALGPTGCAEILHDGGAVSAGAAVETAFLTDGAGVLVGLVFLRPALEVEGWLDVGLFVGWLGEGRLEGVEVVVLHVGIAEGEVLWCFERHF